MKSTLDCLNLLSVRLSCRSCLYIVLALLFLVQINACPFGYYGPTCKSECSVNCLSMECNVTTGACIGGCKDGYVGDTCDEECQEGFYGHNCTFSCSVNCADGVCDQGSGNCLNGCRPGYLGNRCENACSQGYHGDGCKSTCPVNCAGDLCHHETGHCLKGCEKEFWGVDCSLVGDLREVQDAGKQKFYNSLSAESRSVLLYILMGKYEETLERAQMEISKGIRQRNEIRELIGDGR